MGSRSRKRGRAPAPPSPRPPVPKAPDVTLPSPPAAGRLDEFSAIAPPAAEVAAPPPSRRLRGEAANEAVRATLHPLAPGERPVPLLIAVGLTLLLGVGNLASYALGFKVHGRTPPATGVVGFASIMLIMAWGMWTKRYWALLGFQALLALIVVIFALFLPTASNLQAVVVCVLVAGLGGWLFWKLVRVLSRVQMPERPRR